MDTIDLDKTYVIQALNDFEKYKVDFPDCIYKQFALRDSLKIASFDRDFKILGVNVSSR